MSKIYVISSTLMAVLFLVSAYVQFHDKAWYVWMSLYGCAAYVNLASCWTILPLKWLTGITNITLYHGQFLLSNVILEDYRIWSLDLRQTLVKKGLGSVMVILSMILQLPATVSFGEDPAKRKNLEVAPSIKHGMALLVVISYGGICLVLMMYPREGIKSYSLL